MRAAAELTRVAVRANPGNPKPWQILGGLLLDLGAYEDASATLTDAVAAVPDSVDVRLALIRALMAQDRFEDALQQIDAVLILAPGDARARQLQILAASAAKTLDPAMLEGDDVKALLAFQPVSGVQAGAAARTRPCRADW